MLWGDVVVGHPRGLQIVNLLNRFQVFSVPKVWLAGQFGLVYCIATVAKKGLYIYLGHKECVRKGTDLNKLC